MNNTQGMNLEDWHHRFLQQARWTKNIRQRLLKKKPLQPGNNILEVGSGTGAILSQIVAETQCRVTGIDIDLPSLLFAKENYKTCDLAQADAYRLPFNKNTFTMTFCHYLLMWVTEPIQVLTEMHRVTQSGGCVIALAEPDYSARIDFPPPLDQLGQLQNRALRTQGANIRMGRKLGNLFHQSNFSNIEVGILGAHWNSNKNQNIDEGEWVTLFSDLGGVLSKAEMENFKNDDQLARKNAERVLFVPTFYAAGIVN